MDADVILSTVPLSTDAFERPTRVLLLPESFGAGWIADAQSLEKKPPLAAVIARLDPDVRPLRVALVGVGPDSIGLGALLRSSDGRRIDSVVLVEGPVSHGEPGVEIVSVEELAPWAAFGRLASAGARLAVFTAVPIDYAGQVRATDVLRWLWRESTGRLTPSYDHEPPPLRAKLEPPVAYPPPAGASPVVYTEIPVLTYRNKGNLWVFDVDALDPVGHQDAMLQVREVLPRLVGQMLARRWNSTPASEQFCEGTRCWPSTRLSDAYIEQKGEPMPLEADYGADPSVPVEDKAPPSEGEEELLPFAKNPRTAFRWVLGIAASLAVIEVLRYGYRHISGRATTTP